MDISYALRSKFLFKCEEEIRENLNDLRKGIPLRIEFESGGYNNGIVVTIDPNDHNKFDTDWEGKDPTRFPARIKAAATALYNCSCFGRYVISHNDGTLVIRQI